MEPARDEPGEVLIVTGMSGEGRSTVANALEDLDWYVVDNLPAQMLTPLVGMMQRGAPGGGVQRLAAVVDVRGGEFFADLAPVLADMRAAGTDYRILFLDATDEVLCLPKTSADPFSRAASMYEDSVRILVMALRVAEPGRPSRRSRAVRGARRRYRCRA